MNLRPSGYEPDLISNRLSAMTGVSFFTPLVTPLDTCFSSPYTVDSTILVRVTRLPSYLMSKDYLKQYAPNLEDVWTPYLEHDSVMTSHSAGPQKESKNYNPKEEEHFGFEVDDARIANNERVLFTCFRDRVEVAHLFSWEKDHEPEYREDYKMTHEDCLKYLSQLPRPWSHYATFIKEEN